MLMLLFPVPKHYEQWGPKMLRAAIGSGLPILAHHAHSANMGTRSRDYIYGSTIGVCGGNARANQLAERRELWQRRFAHFV